MYVEDMEKLIAAYKDILIHIHPSMSEIQRLKLLGAFATGLEVATAYHQFGNNVDVVIEKFRENNYIIIN